MDAVRSTLREYENQGRSGAYAVSMWRCALASEENGVDRTQGALPYIPEPYEQAFAEGEGLLDIGCLGGYGLYDFIRRTQAKRPLKGVLVGLDVDDVSVSLAHAMAAIVPELRPVDFLKGSIGALPFAANTFQRVVARLVLPYVPVHPAVEEMARVLKHNGLLLLQVHSSRYYLASAWRYRRHFKSLVYYLKPLVAGFVFRLTGRQFTHPFLVETAVSTTTLKRTVLKHGLRVVWMGGPQDRPVIICQKHRES